MTGDPCAVMVRTDKNLKDLVFLQVRDRTLWGKFFLTPGPFFETVFMPSLAIA
jgi:hypothetical protein